jgi:hypothetical protein
MDLPVSLLNDVKQIPCDRPVTLLMRHSARYPITDPAQTYLVGLTEEGVQMANVFGLHLKGLSFQPGRMMAAPVGRCIHTAEAIAQGAGWTLTVKPDDRLSHPFMEAAWGLVESGTLTNVFPAQIRATLALLLDFQDAPLAVPGTKRLDIMVTHDTVVGSMVGWLLHAPILGPDWPTFLEGLFVWQMEGQVFVRWRGHEAALPREVMEIEA